MTLRVSAVASPQKKLFGNGGLILLMVGVVNILHGFFAEGAVGAEKRPVTITQDHPLKRPSVREDHSHVTINPAVSPHASVVTYDFTGMKRTVSAVGSFTIQVDDMTPQIEAFHAMAQLEQDHNWFALKELCEKETKETPEWLTPPLFCGRAYIELGDIERGIERVEYVRKRAVGRKDYAVADQFRERIRQIFGK